MLLRTVRRWLGLPSLQRARRSRYRLRVEELQEKSLPSAYSWTGATFGQLGGNLNWGTAGNWKKDGGLANEPPDGDDDVTFGGDVLAGDERRNPVMEGNYTINTLKVLDITGNDYVLTLSGELEVFGNGPSTFDAGEITGAIGEYSKVTFGPSEVSQFNWTGGKIVTEVDVLAGGFFHIKGNGYKELRGIVNVFTTMADWNGEGSFDLTGNSAKFWVRSGGAFSIGASGTDLSISLVLGTTFQNDGTVTTTLDAGKTVSFPDPGFFYNFGTWNVTQGKVSTRNLQNSGTINIAHNSIFTMGVGVAAGSTYLNSTSAPSGASTISGAGKATFKGNGVSIAGTANYVANVDDECAVVTGSGKLIITGTYNWNPMGGGQVSHWTGSGVMQVGTETNASAVLNFPGEDVSKFKSSRSIVNYGTIEWEPSPAVPKEFEFTLESGASIDNRYGAQFKMLGSNGTKFWIYGTGTIWNAGFITTSMINGFVYCYPNYVPYFTFPLQIPWPVLWFKKGGFEFVNRQQIGLGRIQIDVGATLVCAAGLDQSGGEIINSGETEVTNGYDLSGGTLTSTRSGTEPATFTADEFTQTGGDVVNRDVFDVTGELALAGGTFTSQSYGSHPAQLSANTIDQSGGTFYLHADYTTLDVADTYTFTGGTATVTPTLYVGPASASFGQLIVEAANFNLGGPVFADEGILVTASGRLQIVGYSDIEADVTNNGILDVCLGAVITGHVINNGLLHIGTHGQTLAGETVNITGDFTQSSTGTLRLDMDYGWGDLLVVSDLATLDGTLDVDGPATTPYTFVQLMTYGSRSGTFASLTPPGGDPVEIWYDDPLSNSLGIRAVM